MTLEELAETIDRMRQYTRLWERDKEKTVRVRLNGQKSIGPLASSTVSSVYAGFDWDANTFFIEATDPLIRLDCPDTMKRDPK